MSFKNEKDGQDDFYNRFLKRIDSNLTQKDIISDNNDGVINGNLLEFKLNVNDLKPVLIQCIKYLSNLRRKGKSVPAYIHIVDLNKSISYCYYSEHYLEYIEKIYVGGASKKDTDIDFNIGKVNEVLHYDENPVEAERLIELFKQKKYTKIHIDENCIVGWAKRYYSEVPHARKEDFIGDDSGTHKTMGEIRNPQVFKDYIYPYTQQTNLQFKYLMDMLNANLQKTDLGAFYTPELYAKKSAELVVKAIERVPEGNDYVIIDRCAGTGNLEDALPPYALSHCIVSTYEYYEYKVLMERLGDKVRAIIPPVENCNTFIKGGYVNGANALSEEFINNPIIKNYLDNDKCTIILYENPPYSESSSIEHQKSKTSVESGTWKNSYVVQEMKKEVKGVAMNELANAFIWSAFKFYLRQPTDSYIVYSPAKYFKSQRFIEKEFLDGFAFNRKHFHASSPACVTCVLWSNNKSTTDFFDLEAYDIDKNGLKYDGVLTSEKLKIPAFSDKFYDKRTFPDDDGTKGIILNRKGLEIENKDRKIFAKPLYNDNILGYLVCAGAQFGNHVLNLVLVRSIIFNVHGFFLRTDNYLEKLPLFCAGRYLAYNNEWYNVDFIKKSSDGYELYVKDVKNGTLNEFLLKCLFLTCLDKHNHIRSLHGSDGIFYRNELCFDTSNGETIASKELKRLNMNDKEINLFRKWNDILKLAKETKNYNANLTYGVYQISDELDTFVIDKKQKKYDYPELHTALNDLRNLVKDYYNSEILPVLMRYEFLK